MKHKHADLIHAWADGAEIQRLVDGVAWEVDINPLWHPNWQYRIKPEEKKPVVRWLWVYKDGLVHSIMRSDEEANEHLSEDAIKLEWSRTEFPE